ncbi:unnamed protein product [Cunninghamella blakesleeana]
MEIIERKKRQKCEHLQQAEIKAQEQAEATLCRRCGQTGHCDARSNLCPHNFSYQYDLHAVLSRQN